MSEVLQIIDVRNRYRGIASLPMNCGYIDILAIRVDCPRFSVVAHDFFNISLEIVDPLLVMLILLLLRLRV